NGLHGGMRRVNALAAGAAGAADGDVQFLGLDLDVDLLGLGQHGDGGGAGVDAALRFGRRHALDAVNAPLVFEALVNIGAAHAEDDFLEAAEIGGTRIHGFDLPALHFGVAGVHPIE